MAVIPTIDTPFEPMLPRLPVLPEVVDPDNLKQVLEEFLEYQHQLAASLRDFGRAVSADITLGHTVYPKTTAAVAANVLEDGLAMEWDDPRAYAWAKINGTLRILTNCPQGFIIYSQYLQNSAVGGWGISTWTFPQGGFANVATIVVTGMLEGVTAHMHLDSYLHHCWHLAPTVTEVTFYIDEWFELDGIPNLGPRSVACASDTVGINAMAMGDPK